MDQMKQKKLMRRLYKANLSRDQDQIQDLYSRELAHILEKRREGKNKFSPKWCVTDNS